LFTGGNWDGKFSSVISVENSEGINKMVAFDRWFQNLKLLSSTTFILLA
jgi:hypothetical protein